MDTDWALAYLWSREYIPQCNAGIFTTWPRDVQIRVTRNSAVADAAGLFASPEIFSAEKQVIMPSSSLQFVCHEVMFID